MLTLAWRTVNIPAVRADARKARERDPPDCLRRASRKRQVIDRATPGPILPDWNAVIGRDYHSWDRDHVKFDTAGRSIAACVELVLAAL
jgi:hypothetical protein